MLRMRKLFAVALLVPFLATSLPVHAAKKDVRAARAECFRQANAAANAASGAPADPAAQSERQAAGMDAYRSRCFKAGVRPKILGHLLF
jgi:hypothetical protein